jgi:hypothetical protein
MKLIETAISETSVWMRYADETNPDDATQWVDFQIPLKNLAHPFGSSPLGDPESSLLAEVRLSALRAVRDVIGGEIQRLTTLAGRSGR